MDSMASQITSLTNCLLIRLFGRRSIKKHQNSASLAFVRGNHQGPVNSTHKCPVTRKMLPFDDVIMRAISVDIFLLPLPTYSLWLPRIRAHSFKWLGHSIRLDSAITGRYDNTHQPGEGISFQHRCDHWGHNGPVGSHAIAIIHEMDYVADFVV